MSGTPTVLSGVLRQAREYLRVSKDKSGRLESPEEQHKDNTEAARGNGWILGEPYAETDAVSASRFSRKARTEFERLVADIASGGFGAEILILWESSRGSRRVSEWASLIDACEDARLLIYVTTHRRLYDPANPRDRKSLQEDAIDSEYDSGKMSLRGRRTAAAHAEAGRPHGQVPHGYRRRYDPVTRRLVAQEPDPAESPVIVELYVRLRAGGTLGAIEADFEARGIKTRKGTFFSRTTLRDMALNPAYAGLRVHQPGRKGGRLIALDGLLTEASWPPLIDRETWYAVRGMLTGRLVGPRPGGARHLLSMIAVCGVCGGVLTAARRESTWCYHCRSGGHVQHDEDDLDAAVTEEILAYLSRADVAATQPRQGASTELDGVRAELARAREDLADWRQRAARREVTAASFAAIEPGIVADIEKLERKQAELSAPPALASWSGTAEDVRRRWEAAPLAARRRVARVLLSPAYLGTVRLERIGKGKSVPAGQRITWDREGSS